MKTDGRTEAPNIGFFISLVHLLIYENSVV